MSSMIVAADLDLMMIEISIQELIVPRVSYFDSALLKKTIVMFRLLDKDWTSIYPQRTDYHVYRGSNSDKEPFNGGVSVLFPIPQSSLEFNMKNVDLQLHVRKELSKYFELESCEIVGIACIDVSDLFNGVIDGIKKRKDENIRSREPVAKSSKNTYQLLKEDGNESGANVTIYLRLTHLGQTIISEIEVPDDPKLLFYAREETSDNLPYQFREINEQELTSGCWGSGTLIPPRKPEETICCCDSKDRKNLDDDNGLYSYNKDLTDLKDSGKDTKTTINQNKKKKKKDDRGVGKNETKNESKIDNNNYGGDEKFDGDIKQGNGEEDGKGMKKEKEKEKKKGKEKVKGKGETEEIVEVEKEEVDKKGIVDDEGQVSCLVKPDLCGREGTCNKKDKKGKFGKCGRPDGEGGNPQSCGEQRKCARRKMAAGSATVGIVDKKIPPCPPPTPVRSPNICPCPISGIRNLPDKNPWSTTMTRYNTITSPCARCATDRNYRAVSRPESNLCHNYETRRYNLYEIQTTDTTSCRNMHVGW